MSNIGYYIHCETYALTFPAMLSLLVLTGIRTRFFSATSNLSFYFCKFTAIIFSIMVYVFSRSGSYFDSRSSKTYLNNFDKFRRITQPRFATRKKKKKKKLGIRLLQIPSQIGGYNST